MAESTDSTNDKTFRGNRIFSSTSLQNTQNVASHADGSYFKKDRVNLLTSQINSSFNTYRNWNEFDFKLPAQINSVAKDADGDGVSYKGGTTIQVTGKGVKSLFSNMAAIYAQGDGAENIRNAYNIPLLDSPELRKSIRNNTNCTIKTLVNESEAGNMGRAIYGYADFMYCKHLGKVPNNYLITLRKFPSGCSDHIMYSGGAESYNKHLPDIGRMVTWLGVDGNNMNSILKYSYKIPWQENKAPVDEDAYARNGGAGALGKILSSIDPQYSQQVLQGYQDPGENKFIKGMETTTPAPYDMNADLGNANRIASDLQNTIRTVMVPGGKEGGLTFSQDISLVFNYELRSYDGINPRSAMLDLLGNIMMVTYMQGKFFAGSYRGIKSTTTNVYANLQIFSDASSGNIKTPADLMNSMWGSVTSLWSKFTGDPAQTMASVSQAVLQGAVGNMLNKLGRPEKFSMTSLISATPTGPWHLTIGNPRHPILSIGNLILEDAEVEHYGPLGLDDFPTGLKVTVKLKHAKPRDSVAIEQMYMHGDSRIYTPMDKDIATMYEGATGYKSYVDTILSEESSTYSNSSQSGSDKADVSENQTANTDYANKTQTSSNIYNRMFGTEDIDSIIVASREAMVGAKVSKENTD